MELWAPAYNWQGPTLHSPRKKKTKPSERSKAQKNKMIPQTSNMTFAALWSIIGNVCLFDMVLMFYIYQLSPQKKHGSSPRIRKWMIRGYHYFRKHPFEWISLPGISHPFNPDCKFFPSQGVVTASSSPRSPNQNQDWSIRRPRNKKHTRKSAKSHEFEHVFFGGRS